MTSPGRLLLLFAAIFSAFAAGGILWSMRPADPSLDRASALYAAELPDHADLEILSYIEATNDEANAWCLALAEHARDKTPVSPALAAKLNEPGLNRYKTLFAFVSSLDQVSTVSENWALLHDAGCVLARLNRDAEAITLLKKAEILHPDPDQRYQLLHLMHNLGWKADFRELMSRSEYYEASDAFLRMHLYQLQGDAAAASYWLVRHEIESYETGTLIAAVAAGLCWLILLLQLGRVQSWPRLYVLLVPAALLLGALSAYATVFAVSIEEHFFVFDSYRQHWLLSLVYAVLGIGIREEVLKLLFALPVLFAARKGSPLIVLCLAACVGLGFAIEENTQYYAGDWGAVLARFLTANFAHMMWTGVAGGIFIEAMNGRVRWDDFFEQLAFVIAMHGLYDFFLIDTSLADLSIFSSIIFIWVARAFFQTAHQLRGRGEDRPPLVATFTAMVAVTAGMCFVMITQDLGALRALSGTAYAMAGSFFISIIFFQEFARRHG